MVAPAGSASRCASLRRSPGLTAAAVAGAGARHRREHGHLLVVNAALCARCPTPTRARSSPSCETTATHAPTIPFSSLDFMDVARAEPLVRAWRAATERRRQPHRRREPVRSRACRVTVVASGAGIEPRRPRLRPNEAFKGSDHVVLLDWALAQRRFGNSGAAVGKSVASRRRDYQIWASPPRASTRRTGRRLDRRCRRHRRDAGEHRGAHFLLVVGRRRADATEPADGDMAVRRGSRGARRHRSAVNRPRLTKARLPRRGRGDVRLLFVLLGAVVARALDRVRQRREPAARARGGRTREMAVGIALGAGRWRSHPPRSLAESVAARRRPARFSACCSRAGSRRAHGVAARCAAAT